MPRRRSLREDLRGESRRRRRVVIGLEDPQIFAPSDLSHCILPVAGGLMHIAQPLPQQASDNHSHAWRGAWNRPMFIDENRLHPFEIARMTDHNVRGPDNFAAEAVATEPPTEISEYERGWLLP